MLIKLANYAGMRCVNAPASGQEKTHRMIGFVIPNEECEIHQSVEDILLKLLPADTAVPALFIDWLRKRGRK